MILRSQINKFKSKVLLCTPGHKGKLRFNLNDCTEIDKIFPNDYVITSQMNVSKALNTKFVRFLVNGSSIGIKASLMSLDGDILASNDCHESIEHGAKLANKKLFKIENIFKDGLNLPLSVEQIENALKKYPSVGSVVLAHPNYYGLNSSVECVKMVKKHGKMLYLDCAHSAHYPFYSKFNCELFSYAEAYNLSNHKTLFAPTQTACLCVNNESLISKIDENLRVLSSTSPFYPFYSYLENSIEIAKKCFKKYAKLERFSIEFKKRFKCVDNDDFTRIVIDANYYNLSGEDLYFSLIKRNIYCEKFDSRYVVLIVTPFNSNSDLFKLNLNLKRILK